MKKCECGEGIPEGSKVFHHPEVGYLGPCCASEQDAESVLLAGEDTDEDDTDEDDTDEDDDSDDLNGFLMAGAEECVCVTRYVLGEGDCLELVPKGDVNWQSVD